MLEKETEKLNLALIRGNKAYEKLNEKINIPGYLAFILHELLLKKKLSQRELVAMSDHPKQSINKGIHLLESKGYLRLVTLEKDNRVKSCRLTPKGQEYAKALLSPVFKIEEQTAQIMGEEKMKQLTSLMQEWNEIILKLLQEES